MNITSKCKSTVFTFIYVHTQYTKLLVLWLFQRIDTIQVSYPKNKQYHKTYCTRGTNDFDWLFDGSRTDMNQV